MPLPAFREVGSKKTFRAPYRATGIRFYGFLLEADPKRLDALCDNALNIPAGGAVAYRPAMPFVMLSFTEIAKIASTTEPDASEGFVPERESAIWVLTAAEKKVLGLELAERLAWYIPYIFVDSPNALLTGREVEGFPKEMAVLDVADVADMHADAWAFPKYSPETAVSLQPVAHARRTGGDPAPLEALWSSAGEAIRGIMKEILERQPLVLATPALLVTLARAVIERAVTLVFLKQMRDVADSTKACYQAIVEAPIQVIGFRGAGLLPGTYTIDLAQYDSHPIVTDLGLDPARLSGVKGFWVDFDFLLEQGRVVWEAGGQ